MSVRVVEGVRDGPLVEGGVYCIKLSTVKTVYAALCCVMDPFSGLW